MRKLLFTMLIAVTFSFNATANSNLETPIIDDFENIYSTQSQSISSLFFIHPCTVGYINTYIANVDHYGDVIQLLWLRQHTMLVHNIINNNEILFSTIHC